MSADELKAFAARHLPKIAPEQPQTKPSEPYKHICLALLSYDSKAHLRTVMSLAFAMSKCSEKGWGFSYVLREGDSMVARGRSLLASQFLTQERLKECTDLVFVDTDVYWDGDEFERLLSHDVDVIAGAYPYKNHSGNFPLRWGSQGLMEEGGLWVVQAVTPGFLRIRRRALERMVTELPWLEFNDQAGGGEKAWMFFDNLARSNGVYDEGYVFCEHWRSVGGTVYLDPKMHIKHIGQMIYDHGTIDDWMKRKTGEVEKLHHEFPNIPPLKLFQATFPNHTVDLPKEQAEAIAAGAPPIILAGVDYNRKLEGEDAPSEAPGPAPEVQQSPAPREEIAVEPGGQCPPPAARAGKPPKGANGLQPRT